MKLARSALHLQSAQAENYWIGFQQGQLSVVSLTCPLQRRSILLE